MILTFAKQTSLIVVESYNEPEDRVETVDVDFDESETIEVDILEVREDSVDIQFGDGSVAFAIPIECFVEKIVQP
jgi:hypothetical protein